MQYGVIKQLLQKWYKVKSKNTKQKCYTLCAPLTPKFLLQESSTPQRKVTQMSNDFPEQESYSVHSIKKG